MILFLNFDFGIYFCYSFNSFIYHSLYHKNLTGVFAPKVAELLLSFKLVFVIVDAIDWPSLILNLSNRFNILCVLDLFTELIVLSRKLTDL